MGSQKESRQIANGRQRMTKDSRSTSFTFYIYTYTVFFLEDNGNAVGKFILRQAYFSFFAYLDLKENTKPIASKQGKSQFLFCNHCAIMDVIRFVSLQN